AFLRFQPLFSGSRPAPDPERSFSCLLSGSLAPIGARIPARFGHRVRPALESEGPTPVWQSSSGGAGLRGIERDPDLVCAGHQSTASGRTDPESAAGPEVRRHHLSGIARWLYVPQPPAE